MTYGHNGGPPIHDDDDGSEEMRMHYARIHISDLLNGIRTLTMEERGFYVSALFNMYDRMGGLPADDREASIIIGCEIRTYKRLKARLTDLGKFKQDQKRLFNERVEREITAYVSEVKKRRNAALDREEKKRQLSRVADEIGATSAGLRPDFGRTSAELRGEVGATSAGSFGEVGQQVFKNINENNEIVTTTGPDSDGELWSYARALLKPKPKLDSKEDTPLPPNGGSVGAMSLPTDTGAIRTRRKSVKPIDREDVKTALKIYNEAARFFNFAQCEVLTDARAKRFASRLDDIGGVERFRLALRAINKNDFLAGRVKPRDPNGKPFRLDFDKLMQTEGGLGDVLARLLDSAAEVDAPVSPVDGRPWKWWESERVKLGSMSDDYWRRLISELKPNGTWPWWYLTGPPGSEDCLIPRKILDEFGFVEIYKGQVVHD